jgi:hypothetical protein
MARNVNVSWTFPTTRESGKPLNPADIKAMELSISVDSVNWTIFDTYAPTVTSARVTELEPGKWFFQGVVVDTQNKRSAPLISSVVVPDETAPSALDSLTVTLA